MIRTCLAMILAGPVLTSVALAGDECGDCRFFIDDTSLLAGASGVEIVVKCDNEVILFGYSVAIHWDNSLIRVTGASREGTAAEDGDFFQGDFDQSRGLLGYGLVMDTGGSFEKHIAPGVDQAILVITVDVLATTDAITALRFEDAQIDPPPRRPTQNLMTNERGRSIVPRVDDGVLTIETRAPRIEALRDNCGQPGQTFVIDGQHFDEPGLRVRVCGVDAESTLDGSSSLRVTAPTCETSDCVDVEVSTVRGSDTAPEGFCYKPPASPVIGSIEPVEGRAGQTIVIEGENFDQPGLAVRICGRVAAHDAPEAGGTRLRVTAPTCATVGATSVEVCNEHGCATEPAGFTYLPPPVPIISSIVPAEGLAGDQIEIRGQRFDESGFSVQVCGVTAAHGGPLDGGTRVLVVVPACATVGPVNVRVCNSFGCDTETGGFSYLPPPAPEITAIEPLEGVAGTRLSISGENFDQPGLRVRICGVETDPPTVREAGTIVEVVAPPCNRTGDVQVEVCNVYGCDSLTRGFRYLAEPVAAIGQILPSRGRAGDAFTIVGANFDQPDLVVRVCGQVVESSAPRAGGTEIDVVAPPCPLGPAEVMVCNTFGCDTRRTGFTYTPDPLPVLERVEPPAGRRGSRLALRGRHFDQPGLLVRVCGVEVEHEPPESDGLQVVVTAPECGVVGSVEVEVCNDFGCDSLESGFEYLPDPVPRIDQVIPAAGREGVEITVVGEEFDQPGLTVRICDQELELLEVSPDGREARVTAPPCATLGAVDIEVCNDFGCTTREGGFLYQDAPVAVLGEVSPGEGLPGARLTVSGVNFDQPGLVFRICGVVAEHRSVRRSGTLVDVTVPECDAVGDVEVEVCNDFGCEARPGGFRYLSAPQPVIGEITPERGREGSVLTLTGFFFDRPGLTIRICGVVAEHEPPSADGTHVRVLAPRCERLGPVDVEVCNVFGCDVSPGSFEVLPDPVPLLTGISPRSGLAGEELTLNGRNFDQPGLVVRVCGVRATHGIPRDEGRTLDVVAPECSVLGPVEVEVCNRYGCDSEPAGFSYLAGPAPVIEEIEPAVGERGDVFRLTGLNLDQPGLRVRVCGVFAAHSPPSEDGTSVLVLAPECPISGPVDVEVCNDFGCATSEGGFVYDSMRAPVIDEISPRSGRPGDRVTINGRNFDRPGLVVRLCGVTVTRRSIRDGGRVVEIDVPPCEVEGPVNLEICNESGCALEESAFAYVAISSRGFVRGDADASGVIDISDGIGILAFLFGGGPAPACEDAADVDDNAAIEITDSIRLLNWLFLGGVVPPAPSPSSGSYLSSDCGIDRTDEDGFGCDAKASTCLD